MNATVNKKTENKSNAKPNAAKIIADHKKKVITQLKQEIETMTKTINDMQNNPDTQSFMITIPKELFIGLNAYLSEFKRINGNTMSLSEYISDAIEFRLY